MSVLFMAFLALPLTEAVLTPLALLFPAFVFFPGVSSIRLPLVELSASRVLWSVVKVTEVEVTEDVDMTFRCRSRLLSWYICMTLASQAMAMRNFTDLLIFIFLFFDQSLKAGLF